MKNGGWIVYVEAVPNKIYATKGYCGGGYNTFWGYKEGYRQIALLLAMFKLLLRAQEQEYLISETVIPREKQEFTSITISLQR